MTFTPERLTIARERRGLSRAGLARAAGLAERSVRNYESGASEPSRSSIEALAKALSVPVEFFSGPAIDPLGETAASFRAATKLPAYRRRAALAAGALAAHIAAHFEELFELPTPDVPDLEGYEPEVAAESVRAAWGIGSGPAPNMVHLLEAKGIFVFALAEDCRELDAFSFWRGERPFVMLNTLKSGERGRLDAAHELAHLVLHRHVPEVGKEHEVEAQAFAAAFLLPRDSVLASGSRAAFLADVLHEKAVWQVSATAYTRRLHQLGMITDWQYRTLMIELTKLGYRSGEPNGAIREGSRLIPMLLGELRKEGIGLQALADQLRLGAHDVRSLFFGLAPVAVT